MLKAVQQFAIRNVFKNEESAEYALSAAKECGYEAIEMCGFLTRKLPLLIRGFAAMAGMAIGPCGKLDWRGIISRSGLKVVSVHEDLGTITSKTGMVAEEAEGFGTDTVVITGMFKFDYSDKDGVLKLAEQLNSAGDMLKTQGLRLLYHNHNCELCRIGQSGGTALELLIENTDPGLVNFEYDSYWVAETGADPVEWMERLGSRVRLWHINDRGFRPAGKTASIRKSGGMELGTGNMPLRRLIAKAKQLGVEAVILENHADWIDGDPVKSLKMSADFLNSNV